MSHDPWDEHAPAYALGALDGRDLAEFERHLASGCATCSESVRESRETLATIAAEAPPVPPPASVRD